MSEKRLRSPNYPSMSLGEAVDTIGKMFSEVRTSATDREIAVQTMGYSGITGRSGKVLANLIQYGLLEKAGKSEVRVTDRAVEILHPDSDESLAEAVLQSANKPELFQELREKFPGSSPSTQALRSYLLKRGFTDAAIPAAIRAYVETDQYTQQFSEYESRGPVDSGERESEADQTLRSSAMQEKKIRRDDKGVSQTAAQRPPLTEEPSFNMIGSRVVLGGVVQSKSDADRVIAMMQALKPLLKDDPVEAEVNSSELSPPSEQ